MPKMRQTMDIAEQLKIAQSNAEDTGEGDYSNILKSKKPVNEDRAGTQAQASKESVPIVEKETIKETSSTEVPKEIVDDSPKYKEPTREPIKNIANQPKPIMSKDYIKRVIMITDIYRSYDDSIQGVVKKFVKAESDDIEDVIYTTLTTDKTQITALIDLVELKEEDGTSRAFSLMSLDNDRLLQVSNLLSLFNTDYNSIDMNNKIDFCRNLESGINTLKEESLDYLAPVKELLSFTI